MACLSQRGDSYSSFTDKLHEAFGLYFANPYDEQTNTEGILNLGVSQNNLMFDVLNEKFNECGNEVLEQYTHYGACVGFKSFRDAVAVFLNDAMKPAKPILADNLICLNGSASVVEALGMVLADPGEGFLIPAPYYGGFVKDLELRAGLKIVSADVPYQSGGSSCPYELTVDILEKAYNDATQKGIKIRALLLINPHNPLGYIYSEKEIQDYLHFAHRHEMHVILDELYLLSIFKEGCTMKCVLSHENVPDPERLHVVWALSKDFCASGFRCGILHTTNQKVKQSIEMISEFQSVSPLVQHLFTNILNDVDWVNKVYTPTNHKRLRESYQIVCDTLQSCGISYIEAVAGFFVWVDLRHLLKNPTHEDEWRVLNIFFSNKLYISPGTAFVSQEPGWFRIVFSQKPKILKLAMEMFPKAVDECKKQQSLAEMVHNIKI